VPLMCGLAAVFAVAAIVLGVSLGGEPRQASVTDVHDVVNVVFSGGINHGDAYARINPENAMLSSNEVIALYWWITPVGSDNVLYEGEANNVSDALATMRESGLHSGEYMLYFHMECEAGVTHKAGSNFYIK